MDEIKCEYIKQYFENNGCSFDDIVNQIKDFKSNIPALINTFKMSYSQFKELGLYSIANAYKNCEESLYAFYNNLPITDNNICLCNASILECINNFENMRNALLSANISYEYKIEMNEVIRTADIFILSMSNIQKTIEAALKFQKERLFQVPEEYSALTNNSIDLINRLMSNDKYNEAIVEIDKALIQSPNNYMLYSLKGMCYTCLKMYDDALPNYIHSIELCNDDKKLSYIYSLTGDTFILLQKYNDAIVNLTKAIELNMKYKIFKHNDFYFRGIAYLYMEDLKYAMIDFCVAILLDNKYSEEVESIITETAFPYKETVLSAIFDGVKSIEEVIKKGTSLEEYIPMLLEKDFHASSQNFDIGHFVNKVRKIDL